MSAIMFHLNTGGVRAGTSRRGLGCVGGCGIADAPTVVAHGSPYYADIETCTLCGDSWSDGLHERPSRRGWRQEAIVRAVAKWEDACDHPLERDADLYPIPCSACLRELVSGDTDGRTDD